MIGERGVNAAGGPIRETRGGAARVHRLFSALAFVMVLGTGAVALVAGVGAERAPRDPGVCWRARGLAAPRAALAPIERGVASLEDCAAALEAARLIDRRPALGAYQGYFLFVDAVQIASATTRAGFRYPVFQPAQRRAVDEGLRDLIAKRHGALPPAADMVVERQ